MPLKKYFSKNLFCSDESASRRNIHDISAKSDYDDVTQDNIMGCKEKKCRILYLDKSFRLRRKTIKKGVLIVHQDALVRVTYFEILIL